MSLLAPVGSPGLLLLLWSIRTNKSYWFTLYVTGMRFVHTSCKYFKKETFKKKAFLMVLQENNVFCPDKK